MARSKKLSKWDPIEVEWVDVYCVGEAHSNDYAAHNPVKDAIRVTLGYVLRYTEEYLVIAETDDRKALLGDKDCDRVNQIPTSYIARITRMERGPNIFVKK